MQTAVGVRAAPLALAVYALLGCTSGFKSAASPATAADASSADPSTSRAPDASIAWQASDLFAVVTGDGVNTLVGIDVKKRTVAPLIVLEPNEPRPHMDGGMVSFPPWSSVLYGRTGANPLLWSRASDSSAVVVRALDPATAQLRDIDGPAHVGDLPLLYDGKLAWSSAPGPGEVRSRIVSIHAAFDIGLPGIAQAIVAGPGAGRISAAVILPDNRDRIVVVDVPTRQVTELPTPLLSLGHRGAVGGGTLWADDDTLVASVFARIEPTIEDPDNGEPDKTMSLLTWSVDDSGSSQKAVAGLLAGPTLGTTEFYATNVAGADGQIAVITGVFDEPSVEVVKLGSGEPTWKLGLVKAEFVSAITVSGTTLVVLQSRHVTFIDLSSREQTIVELDGSTMTSWVGR